jgi:hypothetical protein
MTRVRALAKRLFRTRWRPVRLNPDREGPYLVFMPERSLDRFSVQHFDKLDGWSNNVGITHWQPLPEPPDTLL